MTVPLTRSPTLKRRVDFLPRIVLELLDAETDALVGLVDIDDDGFDFVALLEHFARMIDLAGPGNVRDVDHAVDAFFEFHERTVGGQVADRALDLVPDHVADFDLVPRIGLELADAEGDLLLVAIDAEDDGFDFLAERENVGRARDALGPGEFGDVDEAFDAFLDFDERAVRHEVDDLAFDFLTDREALFDVVPRIGLHLLEAEGDALLLLVDVEDLDVDVLADLEHFARMGEPRPGHVGDMEQAVDAVQIDERTEIGDVLDRRR